MPTLDIYTKVYTHQMDADYCSIAVCEKEFARFYEAADKAQYTSFLCLYDFYHQHFTTSMAKSRKQRYKFFKKRSLLTKHSFEQQGR